jgi:Kef-type K+ transport system membrane component KefB
MTLESWFLIHLLFLLLIIIPAIKYRKSYKRDGYFWFITIILPALIIIVFFVGWFFPPFMNDFN